MWIGKEQHLELWNIYPPIVYDYCTYLQGVCFHSVDVHMFMFDSTLLSTVFILHQEESQHPAVFGFFLTLE